MHVEIVLFGHMSTTIMMVKLMCWWDVKPYSINRWWNIKSWLKLYWLFVMHRKL